MEIVLSLVAAFATAYTIIYTPFRNLLPKISKTSSKISDKTEVPEVAKETPIESIKAVEPTKEAPITPTKKTVEAIKETPIASKKSVVAVEDKTVTKDFIPEDSMLKRHYLTHLHALTETQTSPQKIAETLQCQPIIIPEDSMLKRHFLTNLRASIESELSPRPTCSALSRHYDALVVVEMDKRLQIAA